MTLFIQCGFALTLNSLSLTLQDWCKQKKQNFVSVAQYPPIPEIQTGIINEEFLYYFEDTGPILTFIT